MAETLTDANDLVTCPMCLNVFDSPRSLPCHHSFCLGCIKGHCKEKMPASKSFCPLCKKNFDIPGNGIEELPRNNHLQRLVDCNPLQSGKKTDAELKALSRRLRGVHCEKHGDRVTTSHCFDCQENVCSSCTKTDHKKHKLQSIETFAAELKPKMEADIREVSARIKDIRSEAEKLKTEREHLTEDVSRQETAIKQKGEELKSAIDCKVEELLQELERIKTDSFKCAQAAETRLQLTAETAQSYCEYLREVQTKGGPHDVVRYANAVHAHSTHLLEQRVARAEYTSPCVTFMPSDHQQLTTRQLLGYIATPLSSAVGTALATLPQGEPLYNVTSLDTDIYVLRWKDTEQIEVFDAESYSLLRRLTIPDLEGFADMTSCGHNGCLYVSDYINDCVHRVEVDGGMTQWPVSDGPCGMSVSATTHNVLVTCHDVCTIKEFSPRGDPVRTVTFADEVVNPWHTIQLTSGQMVVCHGGLEDPVHRVCQLDVDGCVVQSLGGPPGSTAADQLNVPWHLAADDDDFIFVADHDNRRVVLLSPRLEYLREVVSRDRLRWDPHRLCVDVVRRRLYVVENEWKDGEFAAGRVVIYNI